MLEAESGYSMYTKLHVKRQSTIRKIRKERSMAALHTVLLVVMKTLNEGGNSEKNHEFLFLYLFILYSLYILSVFLQYLRLFSGESLKYRVFV